MDERADERRGFDGGDPARRSRDGDGKIAAPVGPVTGQRDFAQQNGGRIKPDERRDFDGGAPARRSRDGNGKTSAPVGPMTGQPGFAVGEMRPNGSKSRGESGSRVWEKRKAPAFAGLITSLRRPTFLALRK